MAEIEPSRLNNELRRIALQLQFEHALLGEIHGRYVATIKEIGGWFLAGHPTPSTVIKAHRPLVISRIHGRSAVILKDGTGFISLKGIGWTSGGPRIMVSPKDPELIFGLLPAADAIREVAVSEWLQSRNLPGAEVLGRATLMGIPSSSGYIDLTNARWLNGHHINANLLYTRTISPVRVADVALFDVATKGVVLDHAFAAMGWTRPTAPYLFSVNLGNSVGRLHAAGCVNDTLSPDNVTLCGELLDFEWFTVPGIALPDGTSLERLTYRQQKEILYLVEVCQVFCTYLDNPISHSHLIAWVREGYQAGSGPHMHVFDDLLQDLICPGITSTIL